MKKARKFINKTSKLVVCLKQASFAVFLSFLCVPSHAQEKQDHLYVFPLNNITVEGGETLVSSSAYTLLKNKYLGHNANLRTVDEILEDVKDFYKTQKINGVTVKAELPTLQKTDVTIYIQEPPKAPETPVISTINFTGKITLEGEKILNIADLFVGRTHTVEHTQALTTQLQNLYKSDANIIANVEITNFNEKTGELFINIIETTEIACPVEPVAEVSKTSDDTSNTEIKKEMPIATAPKKETSNKVNEPKNDKKDASSKLHEVYEGIFLKQPMPKGWKPAQWVVNDLKGTKKKSRKANNQKPVTPAKKDESTPEKTDQKIEGRIAPSTLNELTNSFDKNPKVKESSAIIMMTPATTAPQSPAKP